jgi:catechol 2,3-dioxygenase-like lactoylglutathione lyase family enzyme
MAVKRVVANLAVDRVEAAAAFYGEVLGMKVVMDFGWIVTFAAKARKRSSPSPTGAPST